MGKWEAQCRQRESRWEKMPGCERAKCGHLGAGGGRDRKEGKKREEMKKEMKWCKGR